MNPDEAAAETPIHEVERFETSAGRTIYRLPVEVFPNFFGNAYVVDDGDRPVLVDCGSGQESSNRDLERGLETIGERFGASIGFADLGAILVTHGHIDHFGGLHFVRRRLARHRKDAPIGIHVLDRRVLTSYEERLVVSSNEVEAFFGTTGARPERQAQMMEMSLSRKNLFKSIGVDFLLEEGPVLDGAFQAYHTPGHCPGQVCLAVDDVMLTADHVLPRISPHLSPERTASYNGVGHYLEALEKVKAIDGIRLGLGGHLGPIQDVGRRAEKIRELVERRLSQVLRLCAEPRRIVDLSFEVFGRVRSYHVILALLETGAYVEFLHQRGDLVAVNLDELDARRNTVVVYRRA